MFAVTWYINRKFSAPAVTTEALARQLDSSDAPIELLDCRTQEEYRVSRLPGAKHLDFNCSEAALQEYAQSVSADNVVCYCSVGYRSAILTNRLNAALEGKKAVNLEGSIFKWANEGRQVNGAGGKVHPYERWASVISTVQKCLQKKSLSSFFSVSTANF